MAETLTMKRQPRRASVNGTRNRLTVKGKDPAFEYRVVNDEDDRIQQFQELGYEIVNDTKVQVGDKRVAVPSAEGSPVKISVGGGKMAYVMRIRKEFYDEDQKTKATQINETEATMKKDARINADFGKLELKRD